VLSWAPAPVDFGYVTPGLTVQRTLTFTNAGSVAVNVTLATPSPLDFSVMGASAFTVPANDSWPVTLNFRPQLLGLRQGTLSFTTSLAAQPNGQVTLRGVGGGPDIDVTSPLAFGQVAYFAGSSQTRALAVRNVGTVPAPPDPNGNLRLGAITITAANAQSTASELAVTLPASYDPMVGLVATAGSNATDLTVRLTPSSTGMKAYDVAIASNDPDEPSVTVRVTADVMTLPACTHTVTPSSLEFGLVASGATRVQPITIRNTGTSACLVSDVRMASGAPAGFSIEALPASNTIAAGASLTAQVRYAPDGLSVTTVSTLSTSVQFQISAPSPSVSVPVTAQSGADCLVFSPHARDYGNIQTGCRSPSRVFTVHNTCVTPVSVGSVTTADPQFAITSAPAAGTLLQGNSSMPGSISVHFRPSAVGAAATTLRVAVTQAGQAVVYALPLRAAGVASGATNVDTETLPAAPKADVLLVVDDTGTMAARQTELGNQFAALTQYATAVAADWQIGVINADPQSLLAGRLVGDASNPKILRPTTPNVATLFRSKVNLGVNGGSIESVVQTAVMALSTPLRSTDNAGFLRRDAVLGVIGISDADDQSSLPLSASVARFLDTKERATDVTFNGMRLFTMPPMSCLYEGPPGTPNFAAAIALMNGSEGDICATSWTADLERIGKVAFGYRTDFYLNAEPDLSGGHVIVVHIDGVMVPAVATNGATVWTFDPLSNAVVFEPVFAPEPGDTLTMTYSVACIP